AAASVVLGAQQGFATTYVAWGNVLQGWALTRQEQRAAGMATMQQGIEAYAATGSEGLRPYFLALLAEAHSAAGQPKEGLRLLTEAQAVLAGTEDRFYEAEVYRLKGELLQQAMPDEAQAETWLQRALDVARRQEAKSLELRAAMSLARLW